MSKIKLDNLKVGQGVADAHHGEPDWATLFDRPLQEVERFHLLHPKGCDAIERLLLSACLGGEVTAHTTYVNKAVVLVGQGESWPHGWVYQFAYSYDGRGVVVISLQEVSQA